MLPVLHILPQYGSISLSTIQNVFLIGSGQKPSPPNALSPMGAFDAVLGTSPEVLNKAIHHYSNQDVLEALTKANRRVAGLVLSGTNPTLRLLSPLRYRSIFDLGDANNSVQEGDAGAYPGLVHARWDERDLNRGTTECVGLHSEIDLLRSKAVFDVRRAGLNISLQLQGNTLETTGYKLTLSEDHIKTFLKASLKHYAGALAPRGETILEDRLLMAANLVYHQQYGQDEKGSARPVVPELAKLVPEIEKNADDGLVNSLFAVRAPDLKNPAQNLLCLSVNEEGVYTLALNRPSEQTGLWPLKKNVLMLGATVMHMPDFYLHFLDLMGPIL